MTPDLPLSDDSGLSCLIPPGTPSAQALELVQLAERVGYESVRCTHVNGHDSLSLLAAAATLTQRVRLSTAVVPIYARTPAATAQTAATIAELSGGRFSLGLGVSHRRGVEGWYGQRIDRPVAELKEYVRIVRAIVDGHTPPTGRKWSTAFALAGLAPVPPLPILGAALSPGMLRAVGEVCDGVVLWMCVPSYIEDVVLPELATGRERAGRTMADFEVVALVPSARAADRATALDALRGDLTSYFSLPFYRTMLERSGFGSELADYDRAGGDPDGMRAAISNGFLDALSAIGDPARMQDGLDRYRAAGATSPCVWPIAGVDPAATLRAVAPTG